MSFFAKKSHEMINLGMTWNSLNSCIVKLCQLIEHKLRVFRQKKQFSNWNFKKKLSYIKKIIYENDMKSSYTNKFLKYRDEWGEGQYYGDSYKINMSLSSKLFFLQSETAWSNVKCLQCFTGRHYWWKSIGLYW